MPHLSQQQFHNLDLKALAYSLTGGICLLFALMTLGPGIQDLSLRILQENSLNFFLRCNTNNCSSLIIPFIAYLLNLGSNLGQLLILWLAINTVLSIYFFYQITKTFTQTKHVLLIASTPFVLIVLNVSNPSPLLSMLPFTLSALLASVLYAQEKKGWVYFVTGAALFDLTMGLLLFSALVCYLMITKEGKQVRRDMLRIVNSIALACAIIVLYLLLIEYNFLEWGDADKTHSNLGNPILQTLTLSLSYLTVFIALTNNHARKISQEH